MMLAVKTIYAVTFVFVTMVTSLATAVESDQGLPSQFFTVEGKVSIPQLLQMDWVTETRILVDGGKYLGFLREDGSFVVTNVPAGTSIDDGAGLLSTKATTIYFMKLLLLTGSYMVEVASADFDFDPARVEITSKGKMRSRRVNNLGSGQPVTLAYPLRFKAKVCYICDTCCHLNLQFDEYVMSIQT